MSIYSTLMCPECKEGFLGISTAFGWCKLRFDCSKDCGYSNEIDLTTKQSNILYDIIGKLKLK